MRHTLQFSSSYTEGEDFEVKEKKSHTIINHHLFHLPHPIRAPLPPHPHLIDPPSFNVKPLSLTIHRPLLRIPATITVTVAGIRNRQLAAENEVGCEAGVGVRCVVFLLFVHMSVSYGVVRPHIIIQDVGGLG
jgi:hypothetical protein